MPPRCFKDKKRRIMYFPLITGIPNSLHWPGKDVPKIYGTIYDFGSKQGISLN